MKKQSLWDFVSLEYPKLYTNNLSFETNLGICQRIFSLIDIPLEEETLFQSLEKIKYQLATIEVRTRDGLNLRDDIVKFLRCLQIAHK